MNDTPASTPEQIAQTTRYTSYTVFRRLSGLTEDGELTAAQVAEAVGPRTGVVLLSHVAYRSGWLADAERPKGDLTTEQLCKGELPDAK